MYKINMNPKAILGGILAIGFVLTVHISSAYASGPFLPGTVTNPGCLPTDPTCIIITGSASTSPSGIAIASSSPATTTSSLYNLGGNLYWNGSLVGISSSSTVFTDATSTNFFATNLSATNATTSNLVVTNSTSTNSFISNLVASALNAITATIGTLTGSSATFGTLTATTSATLATTTINGSLTTSGTNTLNGTTSITGPLTLGASAIASIASSTTNSLTGSAGILSSNVNGVLATTSILSLLNGQSLTLSSITAGTGTFGSLTATTSATLATTSITALTAITATIAGDTIAGGNLNVVGTTTTGNLTVSGTTTFNGPVVTTGSGTSTFTNLSATGNLTATGNTQLATTTTTVLTANSASVTGTTTTQGLSATSIIAAIVNATTGFFTNLTAANATTTNLIASNATTTNLAATNGVITNSTSTNSFISNLVASALNAITATIGTLTGSSATFGTLTATTSATLATTSITALTAASSTITGNESVGSNLTVTGTSTFNGPLTLGASAITSLGNNFFAQNGNSFGSAAVLGTSDNNMLQFKTNNATAMTILTSGNIGVGTVTPTAKIDVAGNINTSAGSAYNYNGANVVTASTTLNDYFFGNAGNLTMTGDDNTASGYQAMSQNTTGYNNTANGVAALFQNTSGFNNTAYGRHALFSNTSGSYNSANGINALNINSSGFNNTANGASALSKNTTGYNNAANGTQSLFSNTTGISNAANGANALWANTTGNNNTASGYYALFANTTGGDNAAYGLNAGYSAILSDRSSIIDNNMTFIGNYASRGSNVASTTALTNGTAIGYNAQVGCSNCMVLGQSGTNVGIGTSTPGSQLTTTGSVQFGGLATTTGNSIVTVDAVGKLSVITSSSVLASSTTNTLTGSVGVLSSTVNGVLATTSVVSLLNGQNVVFGTLASSGITASSSAISGNEIISGTLAVLGTTTAAGISSTNLVTSVVNAATGFFTNLTATVATLATATVNTLTGGSATFGSLTATTSATLATTTITALTTASSTVTGNSSVGGTFLVIGTSTFNGPLALSASAITSLGNNFFAQNGNSFGTTTVLGTNDNNILQLKTNNVTAMTILANGSAGFGTINPGSYGARLDVIGSAAGGQAVILAGNNNWNPGGSLGSGLAIGQSAAIGNTPSHLQALVNGGGSAGNLLLNPLGGFVGIASTSVPLYALDVTGSINTNAGSAYKYNGTNVITASTTLGNYFFGSAGNFTMTGTNNVGTGPSTLVNNNTGINNTAYGYGVLFANTTGNNNTGLGLNALSANQTGNNNIGVGLNALITNVSGINNTAIGVNTLVTNVSGSNSVAIGRDALHFSTSSSNTSIGFQSSSFTTSGTLLTAVGMNALFSNTIGLNNTSIGFQSGYGNGIGDRQSVIDNNMTFLGNQASRAANIASTTAMINATAIGYDAQVGCSNCMVLGNNIINVGIGTSTPIFALDVVGSTNVNAGSAYKYNGVNVITASTTLNNYFFGNAGNLTMTGDKNTAVGAAALLSNTGGISNTAVGISSMRSTTSGGANTVMGSSALYFNTTGAGNTAFGYLTGYGTTVNDRNSVIDGNMTFIGNQATRAANIASTTALTNGTAIGFNAQVGCSNCLVLGNGANVGIGTSTPIFALDVVGSTNVNAGSAYKYNGVNVITASTTLNNYFFGSAGNLTMTGAQNTASGYTALNSNISGSFNTAAGYASLYSNTTGSGNTANGFQSLYLNTIGINNTANGFLSLFSNTSGNNNTASGIQSLNANTNGSNNTSTGYNSLLLNTTGNNNTANGQYALYSSISGSDNTSYGFSAGWGGGVNSDRNSVIDNYMTFIGESASRSSNVASTTALTNGTAIGFNAQVGCSNCMVLGQSGTNVGIGTSTPGAQLTTTGTVRFANFGAGTVQTDALGNLSVSSDERLKNINGSFTRGLTDIQKLNPISYNWNTLSGLDTVNAYAGFSAQNVQSAIPEAVGTSSTGYLSLQDRPIIAALVNAIKEIASVTGAFKDALVGWLGNSNNGLAKVTAGQLCARTASGTDVCVTGDQLSALLGGVAGSNSNGSGGISGSATGTPPIILITGSSTISIASGATYIDLGAKITGPTTALNLGIATYLNGALTPSVQFTATSTTPTNIIDYVVTDQWGQVATATRTVIVQ